MARPSTLPTFHSLPHCAATLTDPTALRPNGDPVGLTLRSKSGPEYTDLLRRMHEDSPRCVGCGLDTLFTRWDGPQTATLGHLLAPSFILASLDPTLYGADTREGRAYRALRVGYVPGNCAVFCRACIDAANAYGAANDTVWNWDGDTIAPGSFVWLAWPQLRKCSRPELLTNAEGRAIVAAARAHTVNAARERASRGLPF